METKSDGPMIVGVTLAEAGLMITLGNVFWRLPITHEWQALRYTLGTLGILAGFAPWAIRQGNGRALGVLAVLVGAAGVGALGTWRGREWWDEQDAARFAARLAQWRGHR